MIGTCCICRKLAVVDYNRHRELVCVECDNTPVREQMHYCGNPHHEEHDDFPEDLYVFRFAIPYCPD